MKKAKQLPDAVDAAADVVDDIAGDAPKKGGIVRSMFRLVTLPFRLAVAIVRTIVRILGFAIATLLLPIRAAIGVIRRIVTLAADITFALWRLVLKLVGLVVGIVMFFLGVLNATIGGAIRLVLRVITRSIKLVVGTFLFATGIGRKRRKAKKVSAKAKAKVTKAKDKALDLAA